MSWIYAEKNGYKPITTFWEDFTIAEVSGEDAIKYTAFRAYNEWKDNIEYLTELIMVLNHKCWYWYESDNKTLSGIYNNLYYYYDDKAIDYIEKTMTEEEMRYYFKTLD